MIERKLEKTPERIIKENVHIQFKENNFKVCPLCEEKL